MESLHLGLPRRGFQAGYYQSACCQAADRRLPSGKPGGASFHLIT